MVLDAHFAFGGVLPQPFGQLTVYPRLRACRVTSEPAMVLSGATSPVRVT
ncbi:hypothetical protein ACIOEX_10625 [Streptomyces sp. NPDC087850]